MHQSPVPFSAGDLLITHTFDKSPMKPNNAQFSDVLFYIISIK